MELDVRSGELGPPRLAAASPGPVVPGDPSQPRVPLRGQRIERDPGTSRRGRQRLRDRPEQGDAGAAEPAVVGRLGPLPPGRRPPGPERAGGQLRQRQRGLPADRAGRPAPAGLVDASSTAARAPTPGGRAARTRTRSTSTRPTASPSWPTSGSTRSSSTRSTRRRGSSRRTSRRSPRWLPSSGPRHFAFHPDGRFGYVINEMANTVTAFAYDADDGILTEIQTISTLPADFHGRSSHRRGPGPPVRQVPLRVEPRARQHRDLRHRPDDRQADPRRHRADPGQEPAQLRDRPDRRLPARREPGLEHASSSSASTPRTARSSPPARRCRSASRSASR